MSNKIITTFKFLSLTLLLSSSLALANSFKIIVANDTLDNGTFDAAVSSGTLNGEGDPDSTTYINTITLPPGSTTILGKTNKDNTAYGQFTIKINNQAVCNGQYLVDPPSSNIQIYPQKQTNYECHADNDNFTITVSAPGSKP